MRLLATATLLLAVSATFAGSNQPKGAKQCSEWCRFWRDVVEDAPNNFTHIKKPDPVSGLLADTGTRTPPGAEECSVFKDPGSANLYEYQCDLVAEDRAAALTHFRALEQELRATFATGWTFEADYRPKFYAKSVRATNATTGVQVSVYVEMMMKNAIGTSVTTRRLSK
ncbi:MAG TPA: hypothetical protein VN176_09760 [Verrucomicrobiae bacterium]|jgi:hypothetical protein|nr:hypothetical protein [Verrucomicrobiae bacterium]